LHLRLGLSILIRSRSRDCAGCCAPQHPSQYSRAPLCPSLAGKPLCVTAGEGGVSARTLELALARGCQGTALRFQKQQQETLGDPRSLARYVLTNKAWWIVRFRSLVPDPSAFACPIARSSCWTRSVQLILLAMPHCQLILAARFPCATEAPCLHASPGLRSVLPAGVLGRCGVHHLACWQGRVRRGMPFVAALRRVHRHAAVGSTSAAAGSTSTAVDRPSQRLQGPCQLGLLQGPSHGCGRPPRRAHAPWHPPQQLWVPQQLLGPSLDWVLICCGAHHLAQLAGTPTGSMPAVGPTCQVSQSEVRAPACGLWCPTSTGVGPTTWLTGRGVSGATWLSRPVQFHSVCHSAMLREILAMRILCANVTLLLRDRRASWHLRTRGRQLRPWQADRGHGTGRGGRRRDGRPAVQHGDAPAKCQRGIGLNVLLLKGCQRRPWGWVPQQGTHSPWAWGSFGASS